MRQYVCVCVCVCVSSVSSAYHHSLLTLGIPLLSLTHKINGKMLSVGDWEMLLQACDF